MKTWKVAGINFAHMHMIALLGAVAEHPQGEIVGICDTNEAAMSDTAVTYNIPPQRIYTDYRTCLAETQPDIVILCPGTMEHAAWTERVAAYGAGAHIIIEKPFAASLADADRMITAVANTGKKLAVNWPLAWYPPHVTSKRLIDEGIIGDVLEVHYYDGNKADMLTDPDSWFFKKEAGGGSLLDYLGYGVTLGTWFMNNRVPIAVSTITHEPKGWQVDNHSISIVQYPQGLSKFETRWGTFTSPWVHQPQPKCGFVIVGSMGTIASYDYEGTIRLQTIDHPEGVDVPVDKAEPPYQNFFQYFIHCLETNTPITGPLSLKTSRIGQQIVDAAVKSAALGHPILIEENAS